MRSLLVFLALLIFSAGAAAQADDICRDFGLRPTSDEPGARIAYVYGRIAIRGYDPSSKFPKITVNFLDPQQAQRRLTVDTSGNYCFRRSLNGGGTIVVEVEGIETVRKTISSIGAMQTREDFEVYLTQPKTLAPPAVISTKFSRPRNERTVDLYQKTADAEAEKNLLRAVGYVKEIIAIDAVDFIAWAKLGSLHLEMNRLDDAETAFRKSLEFRPDYPPALINLGILAALQKYFPAAIAIFREALKNDPTSARTHRLLGEAYLQDRQGTLGIAALDKALELDPVGMAECHLLKARLYDLADAKNLAAAEYKAFLAKVREHPDRKVFEKYVKDNPAK